LPGAQNNYYFLGFVHTLPAGCPFARTICLPPPQRTTTDDIQFSRAAAALSNSLGGERRRSVESRNYFELAAGNGIVQGRPSSHRSPQVPCWLDSERGSRRADHFDCHQEMQQTSRPLTLHRPSLSTNSSSGLTSRQSHLRANSHSIALGSSLNANHRVTRRKSMTNTQTNVAAVAAAIKEAAGDKSSAVPIAVSSRRNTASSRSAAAARAALVGSLPSPPASLPTHRFLADGKREIQESAIEDDVIDMSGDEIEGDFQKARIRRASDGQPLASKEGKKNRTELKCEKCGKGYKHSSCLTKHLFVSSIYSVFLPRTVEPHSRIVPFWCLSLGIPGG
jgi:hypothetical protein